MAAIIAWTCPCCGESHVTHDINDPEEYDGLCGECEIALYGEINLTEEEQAEVDRHVKELTEATLNCLKLTHG